MKSKKGSQGFSVVHSHAAGIDIGATFHVVAVSPDCDPVPVRQFQSFTTDLHSLSRWLREIGVTSIAMESTGIYWIPVFEILESDGFEVSMELCLKAYLLGYRIKELATIWSERERGSSSFNIFKESRGYIKLYLWAIFTYFRQLLLYRP